VQAFSLLVSQLTSVCTQVNRWQMGGITAYTIAYIFIITVDMYNTMRRLITFRKIVRVNNLI